MIKINGIKDSVKMYSMCTDGRFLWKQIESHMTNAIYAIERTTKGMTSSISDSFMFQKKAERIKRLWKNITV